MGFLFEAGQCRAVSGWKGRFRYGGQIPFSEAAGQLKLIRQLLFWYSQVPCGFSEGKQVFS
ncbi:hypothetical protein CLOSTMETH_02314 [[Clostridium] methylpentosum DSM 5476]|uniref:Uncharacterized protein n=1 Tax=[Clostridium] methylpentosum DSM 5476 TaxID=537013 RepID=C0EEM5_9FIRM|nr:hypothetical protein CLOSTMETH_02314 [[Clostridium] methylpentosum DSM 5476]